MGFRPNRIFLSLILVLLSCLPFATPSMAASLSGTCKNWMTVTMEKDMEKECNRFKKSDWKRFPSRTQCIVCHPDDWISKIRVPPPPAGLPDPSLQSSWSNGGCYNAYMNFVATSKGHAKGGRRQGVFVSGYRSYYKKYHCEVGNTYPDVAKLKRDLLRSCNNFIKSKNNSNKCTVLKTWLYH